jgi:hypothetical protein
MHLGVVMFGKSVKLRYANDEARNYMARAGSMDAVLSHKEDLRRAAPWFSSVLPQATQYDDLTATRSVRGRIPSRKEECDEVPTL